MSGKIFIENYEGKHNSPERYAEWAELGHYKNNDTIWVTPTRGKCFTRVAFSWCNVIAAPNSKLVRMCIEGYEVGEAYNQALIQILSTPILASFKYILCVEEDNTPPSDGLLKLIQSIQKYDGVSGLYWLKGPDGCPQIWGDPKEPFTYQPQPIREEVQEANGLGMGFTLFRLDMFRNAGFQFGKWFKTFAEGSQVSTQDLYFCKRAAELGYKFAVDCRVKVGHVDDEGVIW